jgi:hypothetical protein
MGVVQSRQQALRYPADPAEAEALRAACPPGEVPDADVAVARALALDAAAGAAALPR